MRHPFNFNGGENLTTIGATWFVSYAYYKHIDNSHIAWKNVKTVNSRISVFNRTAVHHKYWLYKIVQMNDENLNKNTIGLNATDIKKMANILISKL